MDNQNIQVQQRDREDRARQIGISLQEFDRLVASANRAYSVIKDMGPFYGKEEFKEPTFRITAEPVILPEGSKEILKTLGNDLLILAKALTSLPEEYKNKLGEQLDYRVPLSWRLDAILNENSELKVNEIEGVDGANALMIAEQLAYNLQTLDESTAAKFAKLLKNINKRNDSKTLRFAFVRTNVPNNPHTPNAERFITYVHEVSKGSVQLDHVNWNAIEDGTLKPEWEKYDGVLNESYTSPEDLYRSGLEKAKLLTAGSYNALVNKGLFALLFDRDLETFWREKVGDDVYTRLTDVLIPTRFIETETDIDEARKNGKVVKTSWVGSNATLVNRAKGVALPEGDSEQSSDERWNSLKDLFRQGAKLIAQEYVRPTKIHSYLRKKATNLEPVDWHNRVCVKYVCEDDPNAPSAGKMALTATEVTLGPDVLPAGRKCAFTAGTF